MIRALIHMIPTRWGYHPPKILAFCGDTTPQHWLPSLLVWLSLPRLVLLAHYFYSSSSTCLRPFLVFLAFSSTTYVLLVIMASLLLASSFATTFESFEETCYCCLLLHGGSFAFARAMADASCTPWVSHPCGLGWAFVPSHLCPVSVLVPTV